MRLIFPPTGKPFSNCNCNFQKPTCNLMGKMMTNQCIWKYHIFRTNPHQCFSEVPICVGFSDVANLALMLLSLYLRTQKCVLENLQRHGHSQQHWTTKHPPVMLVTRERCECLQWLFWQVGAQGWRPWKRGQVSAER